MFFFLKVNLIVAEPYFSSSILPWHNLQFWYIKQSIQPILSNNIQTIPSLAEFYLMPVEFEHLWKIRAPVGIVEGFNLEPFDKIIQVTYFAIFLISSNLSFVLLKGTL